MVLLLGGTIFVSCQKDACKEDYGYSKIYMPQAILKSGGVNNNFPVPSGTDTSTYNYKVDEQNQKVNIILGASVSGPSTDAYSVDVQVNNDTIQKMFLNKTMDSTSYKIMPASMYSVPTQLTVPAGQRGATFSLSVDIPALKSPAYAGKYMVLAVKLANPSKYTLDTALCTTIVILDVNAMVIGPANDITSKYILNPGSPFVASSMDAGGRWGTLQSWIANKAAMSHNGNGGFCKDGDGATMDMECGWGSPQILNGKIYQTITLPAGSYAFDPSPWKWQGTKDPAYVVVAANLDSIPDYSNVVGNNSIWYSTFSTAKVSFQLTQTTKVTVGMVVNYKQDQQGFKTLAVHLYNYPKHL
ncbi:MAG: DUF5013 domain-containing protein [Bacteroidota bacterium]|nr:DUF5013 domain-containing protein [Bacteroidota bacterium]